MPCALDLMCWRMYKPCIRAYKYKVRKFNHNYKMSERVKKYRGELKLSADCTPNTRKVLFSHGDNDFIKAIVDATWIKLDGRIPLTPA